MNTYYERINRICEILRSMNVPYTTNPIWGGYQIRFPWDEGDVAAHDSTYGHAEGMVESYQFPWDEGDVSCLSVPEAAAKIAAYYYEKRNAE